MQNTNRTILKVFELNAEVSLFLKQGFLLLWVEGEISNLSRPASGHLYFSLKDSGAQIRCTLFKNRNRYINVKPQNGQKVLVRGRIGLYEARGEFQLIAEYMEDAGTGLLQKQFEALKTKLATKGWFDPVFKQPLPIYPKQIGIISSPTAAALRDILNVLKRRCPHIPVLIYPTAVQGSQAALQLETAVRQANIDQTCDVLIIARGGGSLEDLVAFNDENLANTIYETTIPIVTGIGHEIDFTIADFVADQRAPTPSAAAELVSPDSEYLNRDLQQFRYKMLRLIQAKFKQKNEQTAWLSKRLEQQHPAYQLQQQSQQLDALKTRLTLKIQQQIKNKQNAIQLTKKRLSASSPTHLIRNQQQKLMQKITLLHHAIKVNMSAKRSHLTLQATRLDAMSPLKTLERGYAIIKDNKKQKVISSVTQLKTGDQINIQMKDGEIISQVL